MMRQILVKKPQLDLLRDAARKAKHRTLQEEGMVLVAKGITSLQELVRAIKG
jgi:type II secretory ATPase GspE/PulE/Tfp pilus assembly ATPase PilB-like protein